MSTESGPSTPSRKRSKWDDQTVEEDDVPYVPQPKRRHKTKPAVKSKESSAGPSQRTPPPPATYKPVHSIYVPPRTRHPPIQPSRSVYSYERLNQIEEGSYGVVFRARDKQTGDIVALKKLKLDEEKNGFPITALREIYALMTCRHENVVGVREVVVGDTLTQCVKNSFMYKLRVIIMFCVPLLPMTKSFCCDGLH
jgi:cell division cycle 2-like protein